MEKKTTAIDEEELKKCEKNIQIYKKYKMFAYDFLFYYAISVMYFTITKGFSVSEVMYITAFYTFFSFFWQITANYIIDKIGLKKSIILGNILVCYTALVYIFAPTFKIVILGEFFGSLGFTLKSLAEGTLCYTSLKRVGKRNNFTKIEGKANSKYYYYDAIASVLSGYLFVINNYLPMILCFLNALVSLILSLKFFDLKDENKDKSKKEKMLLREFKQILKSKRNFTIFMYAFFFMGIISVVTTLYKAILIDLGIQTQYITMIVCMFTIFVGVGAKLLFSIERKTKNKTLTLFAYSYICALAIIGILSANFGLNLQVLILIMLCLAVLGFIQGAYRVAIKKYVLNFTNSGIRTKITSVYYMAENLGSSALLFVSGKLLDCTTTYNACLIFSVGAFVVMTIVLMYMKNKLGLKAEEYESAEINGMKIE